MTNFEFMYTYPRETFSFEAEGALCYELDIENRFDTLEDGKIMTLSDRITEAFPQIPFHVEFYPDYVDISFEYNLGMDAVYKLIDLVQKHKSKRPESNV